LLISSLYTVFGKTQKQKPQLQSGKLRGQTVKIFLANVS
jgi:hypothetical protein